ncbi:MAG: hypothetical protein IKE65_06090 [Clostridia bacterium]|nr:hypothetical protein [Clostridia bacterium]
MDNQNNNNNIFTAADWGPPAKQHNASAPQNNPTPIPPSTPTPTPQGDKNTKMIIIIAVAAVVVIAGIVCAIVFSGDKETDTTDTSVSTVSDTTTEDQTATSAKQAPASGNQATVGQDNSNLDFGSSNAFEPIATVEMMMKAIETKDADLFMRAIVGTGSYKDKLLSDASMTESDLRNNVSTALESLHQSLTDKYGSGFKIDVQTLSQTQWSQSRIDDFAAAKGIMPTAGCDIQVQLYVNGIEDEMQMLSVVQFDGEWIVDYSSE